LKEVRGVSTQVRRGCGGGRTGEDLSHKEGKEELGGRENQYLLAKVEGKKKIARVCR